MKKLADTGYRKYKVLQFWTLKQAVCLLLEIDPKSVDWKSPPPKAANLYQILFDSTFNEQQPFPTRKNKDELLVCAISFIQWAKEENLPIPEQLKITWREDFDPEQYENYKDSSTCSGQNFSFFLDKRHFFEWKETIIKELFLEEDGEEYIPNLGPSNVICIDPDDERVSAEFSYLLQAWQHFYVDGDLASKTHQKKDVMVWVKKAIQKIDPNAECDNLSERIATTLNLNKKPGPEKTPYNK